MKRAAVWLYIVLTVAAVVAVWIYTGPVRAWLFGAIACAAPYAVRRDDNGGGNGEP